MQAAAWHFGGWYTNLHAQTQRCFKMVNSDFDLQSFVEVASLRCEVSSSSARLVVWEQICPLDFKHHLLDLLWASVRFSISLPVAGQSESTFDHWSFKLNTDFRGIVGTWPHFRVLTVPSQCSHGDSGRSTAADSVCQTGRSVWAPGWEHRRTTAP